MTESHVDLSQQIENGIKWTNHLKEEIRKGSKTNSKEIEGDIAGIRNFLSAMKTTSDQIVLESPKEQIEGHFKEMRRYQEAAALAAKEFPLVKDKKNPNFSAMSNAAKNILENLQNAKHWHDLELSEIEKNQKD